MDWFVDASDGAALADLRRRLGDYLSRHCMPDSDVPGALVVASELLSNVQRHAGSAAWVTLEWPDEQPVLSVFDLGPGFDFQATLPGAEAIGGRGLYVVSRVASDLRAERRSRKGSVVSARLPVRRERPVQSQPPRRRGTRLPLLDAAPQTGPIKREAFLLALAVQLAQTAEENQGPDAAGALVAQVGADIGAQMEAEYRRATGLEGPLSPAQLADCLVRLKSAIEGGFYVIEATDTRIVLGNTRCPFGDAVQRAPSLCRMTSSVFGGIAASTTGEDVTVDIQERIAIGDPGCRVVLDLAPGTSTIGHRYLPPRDQ